MLHKSAVEPATLAILKKVCSLPELNDFALGGGTGIALQKGHRLSVDLDFFTSKPFNTSKVYKIISSHFESAELIFEQNQTMMFIINNVKVDFILYPFEWFHPFYTEEDSRFISLEDIIPMKLQAVSNRFSKKDFWDIEFLLNEFPLDKMLDIFSAKFPFADKGYIIHSLTNFAAADNEEDPVSLISKAWDNVKVNLQKAVKDYTKSSL